MVNGISRDPELVDRRIARSPDDPQARHNLIHRRAVLVPERAAI
jgi:hypothetical protein